MEHERTGALHRDVVRDIADTIEQLRLKRQDEWRDRPHPDGKVWTQHALSRHVYPSYMDLMRGTARRLPSRVALVQIADYLQCSIAERNEILRAAGYEPEMGELPADQEQAALEQGTSLIHSFPFPTIIVRRGIVEAMNAPFLAFHGLSQPLRLDGLRLAFDAAFPIHWQLHTSDTTWQHNAVGIVASFQAYNRRFQYEPWYRHLVEACHAFPSFADTWASVDIDRHTDPAHVSFIVLSPLVNRVAEVSWVDVTIGDERYPRILAFLPMDEGGRYVFAALGCPTSENCWEQALTVGGTHGQRSQC